VGLASFDKATSGNRNWPGLKFDNLSLDLILIAMLCILVPNLAALIARIKKFKFGDKEIELNEALDKITRQTENIEDEIASSPGTQFQRTEGPPSHIERYVSDPRGGLIAISADIEKKVLQLLRGQKLDETKRYVTPTKGIEILAQYGRVVQDLPILMRDFWRVRNEAVHGSGDPMTEKEVYRLIDLGVRIMDLLSATPSPIHFDSGHTKAGVEAIVQTLARTFGEETEKDLCAAIGHDFTTTLSFINEGIRLSLLRRTQVRGLDGVTLTQSGKQYAIASKLVDPKEGSASGNKEPID